MNTQRKLIAAVSLCAAVAIPNIASAIGVSGQGTWENTLEGRDLDGNLSTFEAYYDTSLDITWLADANYGYGTSYDSADGITDGRITWANANTWTANLNPYGSGITGWRLPVTIDVGNDGATYTSIYQGVDFGYNITNHSEMSHMFYVTLGDKAYCTTSGSCPQAGWGLPNTSPFSNTGPFSNVQPDDYWSATEYAPDTTRAWYFDFFNGYQATGIKTYGNSPAWAVHDGDVGAVPIPASAWLFGSGLIGLIGVARKKSAQQ